MTAIEIEKEKVAAMKERNQILKERNALLEKLLITRQGAPNGQERVSLRVPPDEFEDYEILEELNENEISD